MARGVVRGRAAIDGCSVGECFLQVGFHGKAHPCSARAASMSRWSSRPAFPSKMTCRCRAWTA
eukprot:4803690-Pyramimonas_sp.AAC.1